MSERLVVIVVASLLLKLAMRLESRSASCSLLSFKGVGRELQVKSVPVWRGYVSDIFVFLIKVSESQSSLYWSMVSRVRIQGIVVAEAVISTIDNCIDG